MSVLSVGDLSQSFLLQRRSYSLKTEMVKLTDELASGQVSDVKGVLAGNHSYLGDIEKDMRLLDGYAIATTEAAQFTGAMQLALGRLQDSISDTSSALLATSNSTIDTVLEQGSVEAETRMTELVSALNSNLAGRNLFSGIDTGSVPLDNVQQILGSLRTAVAGATTAGGVMAAAQSWFDSPTGFSAQHYNGAANDLAPMRIGEGEEVSVGVRADNQTFRDILRFTAVAAIANDTSLGLSGADRQELLRDAGTGLLGVQQDLTSIRGALGTAEARIDTVQARNASEATALEFARNQLLAADPFETATRLEEVQFQLQALYTVTARMNDLSLVNFIR